MHSRFILISVVTLIWQSDLEECLDLNSGRILIFRMCQKVLQNSGEDGIFL